MVSPSSPFDSSTSEVTLIVKGKSLGMTGLRAFSASAPLETNIMNMTWCTQAANFMMQLTTCMKKFCILTPTMSKLSPIDASHLSNLIGCIWRELRNKGKCFRFALKILTDTESYLWLKRGFYSLHNEAWSFCLWCHCGKQVNQGYIYF